MRGAAFDAALLFLIARLGASRMKSRQVLYTQKKLRQTTELYDVSDKIRTRDLLVRSQTLYPAELHLHSNNILYNYGGFVKDKISQK